MARPRNEELYNTIKQTAYRQFMTQGYTDTTYQSIASACGVTRTAVQNYYASKSDLYMEFSADLLAALHKVVRGEGLHQENEFDIMFCIGQSFFAFMMQDDGRRKFLQESVASRELTEETLDFEFQWGIRFLTSPMSVPEQKFHDDVLVSMGGFYTLVYKYLKDGQPIDIPTHLGRVVRTIMHDYGWSYDDAKAFIETHKMTDDELKRIIPKVGQEMGL